MNLAAISTGTLLAFVAVMSALGSAAGVWVTIKVGLAKLETWRDIAQGTLHDHGRDLSLLKEDTTVLDTEMDRVYQDRGWHRAQRQRMRG